MDAEDRLAQLEETIALYEAQCRWCKAGLYESCVAGFDPEITCPEEKVSQSAYVLAIGVKDSMDALLPRGGARAPKKAKEIGPDAPAPAPEFDSGYVHPDAWRFKKNIGEFDDPESTGRKMVKRMYPIEPGVVCEWAGKRVLGLPGGVLIGCLGNPATDWHHGHDKNTLNNEKVSLGVGTQENVHIICSPCHNLAHAQIDEHYPPYDRVLEQDRPWLPLPGDWGPITFEDADHDELLEQQRRRMEDAQRRGRTTTGRNKKVAAVDDVDED